MLGSHWDDWWPLDPGSSDIQWLICLCLQGHVGSQNAHVTEMTVDPAAGRQGMTAFCWSKLMLNCNLYRWNPTCALPNHHVQIMFLHHVSRVMPFCSYVFIFSFMVIHHVIAKHAIFHIYHAMFSSLKSALPDRRTSPALPAGRSHPSGRSRPSGRLHRRPGQKWVDLLGKTMELR